MTRGNVKLATFDGPVEVPAVIFGHLAVHRSAGPSKVWVITHRPTGAMMETYDRRRDAIKVAQKVETECAAQLHTLRHMKFADTSLKGARLPAAKKLRQFIRELAA
jgi:hypothetical protein